MATSTSFQKKTRPKPLHICGTKPSLHNNQLLISSGIPSLDNVIGGGLAVGTLLLVEEDTFDSYSKMALKYFLAEGVMSKHDLFLASADISPSQMIKELPGPLVDEPGFGDQSSAQDPMKIAWRYQHMPQMQSTVGGSNFGHYYDLTKTMDGQLLDNTHTTILDINEELQKCNSCKLERGLMNPAYAKLLELINKTICEGNFKTDISVQHRNILRIDGSQWFPQPMVRLPPWSTTTDEATNLFIAVLKGFILTIHSLGSPLWGEGVFSSQEGVTFDPSLCRFLFAMRSLLRSSYAVCVVTMPSHLFPDPSFIQRVEHMCDTVVKLESFAGSDKEKNPAFREYHGLFHIKKLPRLNSLTCHMPETFDLAFKLKRKKFSIEKLHLPPELSDTTSREQEDSVHISKTKTLDF